MDGWEKNKKTQISHTVSEKKNGKWVDDPEKREKRGF